MGRPARPFGGSAGHSDPDIQGQKTRLSIRTKGAPTRVGPLDLHVIFQ